MRSELEVYLGKTYSALCSQGRLKYREIGCEHEDGWFVIVDGLCEVLVEHRHKPPLQIAQIKEKFGSLHFYVDQGDLYDHAAIRLAEDFSFRICEVTGEPGRPCIKGGWHRTLSAEQAARDGFVEQDLSGFKIPHIPRLEDIGYESVAAAHPKVFGPGAQLDVPPGWLDLVDCMLDLLDRCGASGLDKNDDHPRPTISHIVEQDGQLAIQVTSGANVEVSAIVAAACAMARRLDMVCGVMVT
jgi:hypothetical protein